MTNFDKAAELILPYIGGCTECDRIGDACLDCTREAKDAVKDIAEAGLLAPDLPEAKEMDEELAPLPKPKDCKEEDVYRAKMDYNGQRGFGVAVRCNPEDFYTPWSVTLDDGDHWWVDDSAVTLLARLLLDREVQA